MKKLGLTFIALIFTALLAACNNDEPLIEIEAKISPVSDEEYRSIGATDELENPKQEDFKMFLFDLSMEHSDTVKNRKIETYNFKNLQQILDGIDGVTRYWYGGELSQDNASDNIDNYHQDCVIYTKDLSEEEIRKALKNEKITVSWLNSKNEQITKEYILSDLMEFSSEK